MHIKRFEAPTLLEAIRQVKAELGPDALILSQRELRKDGGWFGMLGRSVVEVTAAVDREVRRGAPEQRVGADPSWQGLGLTRALVEPLEHEVRDLRKLVASLSSSLPDREALADELAALRRAVRELGSGAAAGLDAGPEARLAGRLLGSGLAPRHAYPLARAAAGEAAEGEATRWLNRELVRRLDPRMRPPRSDDAPRVELFVGPTGVGKTTTVAKLAGRSDAAGRVALVTTDAQRVGADAPLRHLAERTGAPFERATSDGELRRTLASTRSHRILVDTAGRSRSDAGAIPELVACREALGPGARVNLVLAATAKDEDLARELERYRPLRPDRLVFTKLDESGSIGNLVNLLLDDAPPLSWIAEGQRVPDDLRIPEPEAFAARVLAAA